MTKVYAVIEGDYDEINVNSVFSTQELADERIDLMLKYFGSNDTLEVVPYEVDEPFLKEGKCTIATGDSFKSVALGGIFVSVYWVNKRAHVPGFYVHNSGSWVSAEVVFPNIVEHSIAVKTFKEVAKALDASHPDPKTLKSGVYDLSTLEYLGDKLETT